MPDLPSGTVTFLASNLGDDLATVPPETRRHLLQRHAALIGEAVAAHGGAPFRAEGSTFFGAFSNVSAAFAATQHVRARLAALAADDFVSRIRLVLQSTETTVSAGRYLPSSLRHVARLLKAARSGQTLVGASTAELMRGLLPSNLSLHDLGQHQLSDLSPGGRIYLLAEVAAPADPRPIKSLDWHPHNLPAQLTPLIGRDTEQTTIDRMLRQPDVRLLTLTGPGGIGKTRLSFHVAAGLVDAFDDGVFFVGLAAIAEPSQVLPAIAQTLGVTTSESPDVREALHAFLAEREVLLVIDNVEHVVDAAGDISELLATCPAVTALTTSREPLNVQGEHTFPVPPLDLPGSKGPASTEQIAGVEAVRLFVASVQKVDPQFALTEENAPIVAEVCRRLDGLPLAIELAAASTNVFTPAQLLERLERRLPLPRPGRRDLPARHQTLRDTIRWSHDLLIAEEQVLFRRLAVFADTFDLDAAEWVMENHPSPPSVLEGIAALVTKSLLQPAMGAEDTADTPRFRMLTTIREFATEMLEASGEAEEIRRRYAEWYVRLAQQAEVELLGANLPAWLARLDPDLDNIRVALQWLIDQAEAERALRLSSALWRYWGRRGLLREGQVWVERALALPGPEPPLVRAKALNHLGNIANDLSDYPRARRLYEESLEQSQAAGSKEGIADSLLNLSWVALYEGQYDDARRLAEASRELHVEQGEELGTTYCMQVLAHVATAEGDISAAQRLHEQIQRFYEAHGDIVGVAWTQWSLGLLAGMHDDPGRGRALLDLALPTFQRAGDRLGLGYTLTALGGLALQVGDPGQAAGHFDEALRVWRQTGRRLGVVECLEGLAPVAGVLGRREDSVRLFGAAAAARTALGAPLPPIHQNAIERITADLRDALGRDRFDAAWVSGASITLDQAAEAAADVASMAEAGIALAQPRRLPATVAGLTPRELQVLCEIAAQKSNAEIAEVLYVSLRTVTTHIQNIFGKLGINSRTAAAVYALKHGFC